MGKDAADLAKNGEGEMNNDASFSIAPAVDLLILLLLPTQRRMTELKDVYGGLPLHSAE